MKKLDFKQLDSKDEEIMDALISLGLGKNVAMALAFLRNADEATSLELERGTGLRQPEVSMAMKQLEERGWINEREEKRQGKGRPYKVYSLKVRLKGIVAELEEQQKREDDEMRERIKRLKELGR